MSRHRNIRNLTDDDYYDYDDEDDYYDDEYDDYGYTEEENEAYYREQQRLKEEEEASKRRQQAQQQAASVNVKASEKVGQKTSKAATKITISTCKKKGTTVGDGGNTTATATISEEEEEKIKSVASMGFSSEEAKLALQKNSWDIESAIDILLASGGNIQEETTSAVSSSLSTCLVTPSKGGKMAPPPGWSKPKESITQPKISIDKGGKMASPPGWSKPESKSSQSSQPTAASINNRNNVVHEKSKPSPYKADLTKIQGSNCTSKDASSNNTTKKVAVKRKKKLSQHLEEEIKGQKSRLSMVILGHVDAGKSTLMGQVCVQMGVVQKRVVDKYQKQGMFFFLFNVHTKFGSSTIFMFYEVSIISNIFQN